MSKTIVLKKGLNIPVKGAAELRLSNGRTPDCVALQPSAFKGLLPRLLVREGDAVLCGSPVIADKMHSDILLTSPVSGTVKEIVRGEKRKLLAVIIENDREGKCVQFNKADDAKTLLLESGMWPWLIQRPYGIIADPTIKPKAIFVSAFNTAPLAADTAFCYADQMQYIQAGIDTVAKLTDGPVNVSIDACDESAASFRKLTGCTVYEFKGGHPAGNVGVQISHISPILKDETVWTVSLAGLVAIGKLALTGSVDLTRKVAVCGPAVKKPAYIETLPGMPVKDIASMAEADNVRFISGDVLTGKAVGAEGYLGWFDDQISVLREGNHTEAFGWLNPLRLKQFSADRCYWSWLMPRRSYNMDTNLHGGPRAFIMNDAYYGRVLPMDIYPLYLVKACLAGDIEKMEKFGIYEVLPEDLATCEFVDPSKNNIQDIIAKGIDLMLKEMA